MKQKRLMERNLEIKEVGLFSPGAPHDGRDVFRKRLSLGRQSFFDIIIMYAGKKFPQAIRRWWLLPYIYNRGVNKMPIYADKQDYGVFLRYLKTYLIPKDYDGLNLILANPKTPPSVRTEALKELNLKNFYGKIMLITYCLMPNHFHLLIHTKEGRDMEYFMRSLMTRYTKYFNARNRRVGPLFQGRYKAVLVETDEQLLYLTRYIHRNPLEAYLNTKTVFLTERQSFDRYQILTNQPSSYPVYLGKIQQSWVQPDMIIAHFSKINQYVSYRNFVEDTNESLEQEEFATIHPLIIDLEE